MMARRMIRNIACESRVGGNGVGRRACVQAPSYKSSCFYFLLSQPQELSPHKQNDTNSFHADQEITP
jgi:hypothetical protein